MTHAKSCIYINIAGNEQTMKAINLYDALKMLRNRTEVGLPSKIVFLTFDDKKQTSNGLRIIDKSFIRASLPKTISVKSGVIISITDEEATGNKYRSFYLPLLLSIEDYKVVTE